MGFRCGFSVENGVGNRAYAPHSRDQYCYAESGEDQSDTTGNESQCEQQGDHMANLEGRILLV